MSDLMVVKDLVEITIVKTKWVLTTLLLADILPKDMPMKETFRKFYETEDTLRAKRGTLTIASTRAMTAEMKVNTSTCLKGRQASVQLAIFGVCLMTQTTELPVCSRVDVCLRRC